MTARTRTARAAASILLAASIALGTSGCGFFAPQATLIQYAPSDGIRATIGDIDLLNVVAFPSEDGHAVSLMVTVVNNGSSSKKVTFQYDNDGEKTEESVTVGASESLSLGTTPDGTQMIFLTTEATLGGLLPVYVQYGDEPGQQLLVPVLPATGVYEGLAAPEILRDAPAE